MARVGMDSQGGKAIAAHDDRVFPGDRRARADLAHRNHPPGHRAPDQQAADGVDVITFSEGRTGDDWQEPGFLGEDSRAGAAWFAVETNNATFETGLQGP